MNKLSFQENEREREREREREIETGKKTWFSLWHTLVSKFTISAEEQYLNPFKVNISFLHRWKTLGNQRFSNVFRRSEIEH